MTPMKKLMLSLTLTFFALPLFANPQLFTRYESVRQSLLKNSLADVKSAAAALAADARKAKQPEVAVQADAVSKSADLPKARAAFAPLSDQMIKLRASAAGAKPAVYHCTMIKKAWLQPKGQVGNPYDPAMPACGTLKEE
jgi:hypothetical protein